MQNKLFLISLFGVMVLLQWFVPSKMIWNQEDILTNGEMYKFECKPIDPYDPFRGKYITLRFEEEDFIMKDHLDIKKGDRIYVALRKDTDGYAKVESISASEPTELDNIVIANAGWRFMREDNLNDQVNINFPFNRFYMEESKAKPAEDLVRESTRDSLLSTYAIVMIKDGNAVIKDVMVDGIPIKDLVEKNK